MTAEQQPNFGVEPDGPCYEFVGHRAPGAMPAALPTQPGQASRDQNGRAILLHFAPSRWLVPAPDSALAEQLTSLAAQGLGALVDVTGKWRPVRAESSSATQALASTISVEAVLKNRDCAATTLFDCPAILARAGLSFDLWVTASYVDHFLYVIRTLRLPS